MISMSALKPSKGESRVLAQSSFGRFLKIAAGIKTNPEKMCEIWGTMVDH